MAVQKNQKPVDLERNDSCCCGCWTARDANDYRDVNEYGDIKYACRWKFCLFWTILSLFLILLIAVLLAFFVVLPNVAQNSTNNAYINQISMELTNPTANSIDLSSTLQILNVGSWDATIHSTEATVYYNDDIIGTLQQPDITIKGSQGATFSMKTSLKMGTSYNVNVFKSMVEKVLNGSDQTIILSSKPKLDVTILGIKMSTHIDLDNHLVIKGASLLNALSQHFEIVSSTSEILNATAQMSFSTISNLILDLNDVTMELSTLQDNIPIGYAEIPRLLINPGYNEMDNITTFLQYMKIGNGNNSKNIELFLSNYMMGIDQTLRISGPINSSYSKVSVIDNVINTQVKVLGSPAGNIANGGVLTKDSISGWKVNVTESDGKVRERHRRGGYVTLKNPYALPLTILNNTAHLYLKKPLVWTIDVLNYTKTCNQTLLGIVASIPGMYKDDVTRTSFVVDSYSQTSAPQMEIQDSDEEYVPHVLCPDSAILAAICRDNPILHQPHIHRTIVELEQAYIDLKLESQLKVKIGNEFTVNIAYNQSFFPIYYGSGVYDGFKSDFNWDCYNNIIIHE